MGVEGEQPLSSPDSPPSGLLIQEGSNGGEVKQIVGGQDWTKEGVAGQEGKSLSLVRATLEAMKRAKQGVTTEIYLSGGDPQKAITGVYLRGLRKLFEPMVSAMREDLDHMNDSIASSPGWGKLLYKSLAKILFLEMKLFQLSLGIPSVKSDATQKQRNQE